MIYCVQALSVELNKELKLDEAQSPSPSPGVKVQLEEVKSANTKCKNCKYYKEGKDRVLFYPKCLVDEDK